MQVVDFIQQALSKNSLAHNELAKGILWAIIGMHYFMKKI